jgi:hypothetical protein
VALPQAGRRPAPLAPVLYPERLTPHEPLPGGGRRYRWGACVVTVWPCGQPDGGPAGVWTAFPGVGCVVVNVTDDPEQRRLADHFGYAEGDFRTLNLEHDPLHTLLAVAQGMVFSPTLHAVALGEEGLPEHQEAIHREECEVWAFARLLNRGEFYADLLPPALGRDRPGAESLAALARRLLRGGG